MDLPKQRPLELCKFCGTQLNRRSIGEGAYLIWLHPDRCTCAKAKTYWAEVDKLAAAEKQRKEQEETAKRKQTLLENSRLPRRYWDCRLETARVTKDNGAVLAGIRVYAEGFPTAEGIFITGPVGTGKTHLVSCLANHLINREIRVLFGNVLDLLGRIRKSYDHDSQEDEWRILDELTTVPLLIIDDLGKEKVTAWVEQNLYHIVDARYRENKPLVITSNYGLSELESRYEEVGPALASRISEMCEGKILGGQDWRKITKGE